MDQSTAGPRPVVGETADGEQESQRSNGSSRPMELFHITSDVDGVKNVGLKTGERDLSPEDRVQNES